jgi:hypothetical protein
MLDNPDISIIIQGPTKYYKDIIGSYTELKNVLWCTWDDEPKNAIKAIEEAGIYLYLIKKPEKAGYWNVNFQCKSSYAGLLKCKELFNTKYYLKIRSDFSIINISQLCRSFISKNTELNFIGWANMFDGYLLDYIVFGDFYNMEKYWEFKDEENNGHPCPEIFLMQRFFGNNYLSKEIKKDYIPKLPLLDDIEFYWVSREINIRDFSSRLKLNYTKKRVFYYLKFKLKTIIRLMNNILKL